MFTFTIFLIFSSMAIKILRKFLIIDQYMLREQAILGIYEISNKCRFE